MTFSIELLQAISDWQRGGNEKQKKKRGDALKAACCSLPDAYKKTDEICFRQIALKGNNLINLGTEYQIKETLSSWTKCESVAKEFKGGVPPQGDYQGVIFSFTPLNENVVVDLTALFEDDGFSRAIEENKEQISS